MRRNISLLLAIFAVAMGMCHITANNSTKTGYTVYSDISAYINNYPIQAYNIDGKTVVAADDLRAYGFDVLWDSGKRVVSILRNRSTAITPQENVFKNAKRVGRNEKEYSKADIAVTVNGKSVDSFNINGRTVIYFDDLKAFGKIKWSEKDREISLTISGLPLGEPIKTQENPNVTLVYAPDGRSLVVGTDEVDAYKNVGWYDDISEVTVTLYAPDDREITVFDEEVSAYLAVGWFRTKPGTKMIALTFDDGPSKYTGEILDQLQNYGAKATFFVVGNRVDKFADTLKRQNELGMEIGSHSWDHTKLTKLSAVGIIEQKTKTDDAIKNIIGIDAPVARPPYGATSSKVADAYAKPLILWSIDTLDWKTKNKALTVDKVMSTVKDGDIILMHDIYSESAEAAVELIPKLIEEGYKLVTVSELGEAKYGGLKDGQKYSSMR